MNTILVQNKFKDLKQNKELSHGIPFIKAVTRENLNYREGQSVNDYRRHLHFIFIYKGLHTGPL